MRISASFLSVVVFGFGFSVTTADALDGTRSPANIVPPLIAFPPQETLHFLEEAARSGDVRATWDLGRMYADGYGVKQNHLRAFEYFKGIAEAHADEVRGTSEARFVASAFVALGRYYLAGIPNTNVEPDAVRACEMFSYAASYFADPDAQYHLGRMHLDGQGTPKDAKQAVRWLSLAAGRGQYEARAVLGALLFEGQSIPRDGARGLMWLSLAKDAATPHETWITDLYLAAWTQATETERDVALAMATRHERMESDRLRKVLKVPDDDADPDGDEAARPR
jgi:TPR repeat protein